MPPTPTFTFPSSPSAAASPPYSLWTRYKSLPLDPIWGVSVVVPIRAGGRENLGYAGMIYGDETDYYYYDMYCIKGREREIFVAEGGRG